MKSKVTLLLVSTGRNGPKGAPTSNPRMVARKSAAAFLSRAATIVWFSSTDMGSPRASSLVHRGVKQLGTTVGGFWQVHPMPHRPAPGAAHDVQASLGTRRPLCHQEPALIVHQLRL